MTPDLLTLIRRACEGTAAEALDPYLTPGAAPTPWCDRACPHYRGPTSCNAAPGTIMEDVCDPAVEALARLALSQAAEVDRLTAEFAAATARTYAGHGRPLMPGEATVNSERVATANPSIPSNGCEPAAVDWVEVVWVEDDGWHLCLPDRCRSAESPYSAWEYEPWAAAFDGFGARRDAKRLCTDLPEACRQIAEWARADGYRVPKHPLGWDVGGDS